MNKIEFPFLLVSLTGKCQRFCLKFLLLVVCLLIITTGINIDTALAGSKDDRYEGNIFVVFAGNGSLVPPKQTLEESLAEHKPILLTFYIDDSRDCKQYAVFISQTQALYGREVRIIPVSVDAIPPKKVYNANEPGYYYSGSVPQIVVFDQSGKVVLNKNGQVPFEEIDDKFRQVFNLVPRDQSIKYQQRSFNEYSSELSP